ncbi:MAG: hypothetical protein Q9199_007457, partial [Rusavskia elegans]
MRNNFKTALLAAGLSSNIGALATVTLTSRVAVCYPSDAPGGNGGGKPADVQTVSSTYGFYSLLGCYTAPPSGYLLDGKTSVSVGMTLASCASYCTGSAFFALQNALWDEQHLHCVYIFAATTTCWFGFRHYVHNDRDKWYNVNHHKLDDTSSFAYWHRLGHYVHNDRDKWYRFDHYKLDNSSSIAYWLRLGYHLYHDRDKWYRFDHYKFHHSSSPAARIRIDYHLHNHQARRYRLNGNESDDGSPLGFNDYNYNDWYKRHRLNCNEFDNSSCSSTSATSIVHISDNICDDQSSWIDNHNVQKHSDHGPSLFQWSTASAVVCGCGIFNKLARFSHRLLVDIHSCGSVLLTRASCIAITWGPRTVGGECYRKFNVTDSRLDPREDSAYKCDQAVTPPSATSIINTDTANIASTRASTPASSGPNVPSTGVSVPVSSNPNLPTTRPTTPATSNAISPATSSPNVPATTPPAWNTGVPATLISSTTTASSFNIDLAFQPCPSSNGQQFVDQLGYVYDINCGCDYQYSDLSGGTHEDYFQDCILACDRYVPNPDSAGGAPCVAVSWGRPDRNVGANCYLKYRVEQVRCGEEEFCAAVKHTYQIPPGIISTSRVTSTASVVPVPASSSRASSSTSQPAVVAPSSTQNTAPINTFAPPRISQTVSCPSENGSIYTDFFGQTWQVRCGMNILGTNAKAVHADSWEKCLQFCDILGNVTGVTYPGGGGDESNPLSVNCYPYSVFTEFSYGAIPTLCAAQPLNISTGNSLNAVQLCPRYDNETFTDAYSRTYQV